ncbi:hypothetical protein F3Y22_tig00111539pilonHSYRG00037 [Hibiscus syriacus]|uniref:Peptidase A1 domain-containing protein n=1 Tax=Hibiscus syriacus TaxID=106335 RepID=A0A6A2YJE1_HIBSY|nr:hypothetical protein F3Y22_tig00111539pilonHSYRG00037 [Hibiscus syriacus]
MMHNPLFLVLAVIFSSLVIPSVTGAKASSSFSVDLIHPPSDLLIPSGGIYLMKLSFGTPPVEYFAIADTGSDLIWIQCLPCGQCYPQGSPPFDPRASSTYKEIPCGSDTCQALPGNSAPTQMTVNTPFATSIFGCGHNNQGKFRSPTAGLVGLGGGPLSLVSQISTRIDNRFSYRLVPRTSSSSSKLLFGQEAHRRQDRTARFEPPEYHNRFGNTLAPRINFYNSLETIVKDTIGADPVQDPSGNIDCVMGQKLISTFQKWCSISVVLTFACNPSTHSGSMRT